MDNNNDSGVNTLLLVIIIVLIVGGAVWYFTRTSVPAAAPEPDSASINVTLPSGNDREGSE